MTWTIIVRVSEQETRYLSEAAIRMGMDLPNYLYRVAVDHANAENRRHASSSNIKVPQLTWTARA